MPAFRDRAKLLPRGRQGLFSLIGLILFTGTIGASIGARGVVAQQPATPLAAGWNNVLYTGAPGPIGAAFASLGDNLTGVLLWDPAAQSWHQYYSASPQTSDLQTMTPGQVYWILVQRPSFLPPGIASPSPAQLLPGWNNVAYLGPAAPGSASLEQSPVWAWDGGSQKWQLRDPANPAVSDLQSLTPLRAYWVNVSGGPRAIATTTPGGLTAASTPTPAARRAGCYPFLTKQPALGEMEDAVDRGAMGALQLDPALELPAEKVGLDAAGSLQPGYVPPTILRSISWIETSWHQATWETQRGQSGPTLTSGGCAYGVMQIASGMSIDSTPTATQSLVGSDFHANVQAGTQLLAKNWNRDGTLLPYFGRHDPHILEDWYFAIWAYHCFGDSCTGYGAHDDPDDPSLPWPRPIYNSQQQLTSATSLSYSDYPYQELVFGLVNNPPIVDGHPLWQPIALLLPPHGAVGFPQPHWVGEPSAHLDNGSSLAVYAPAPTTTPSPATAPAVAPQVLTPTATAVASTR
jgi:hypothetical protein